MGKKFSPNVVLQGMPEMKNNNLKNKDKIRTISLNIWIKRIKKNIEHGLIYIKLRGLKN